MSINEVKNKFNVKTVVFSILAGVGLLVLVVTGTCNSSTVVTPDVPVDAGMPVSDVVDVQTDVQFVNGTENNGPDAGL